MKQTINKVQVAQYVQDHAEALRHLCEGDHISGSCMYCTAVGYVLLRKNGFRVIPQAGSLFYPMTCSIPDDGKMNTHFSYTFEPDKPLPIDSMPEIHAWLFDLDAYEIIDFSTYGLKRQCEAMGVNWPGTPPMNFIWDRPQFLSANNISYQPNKHAIVYTLGIIREIIQQHRLQEMIS